MEKFLIILVVTILSLSGCAIKEESGKKADSTFTVESPHTDDSFYIEEAIELTKQSAELADSKEFVAMYTADSEVAEQIATISSVNYDEPKSVKYIHLNKDKILEFMRANYPEGEDAFDFEKIIELNRFSINNFASIINARFGANMIAATTVLSNSRGYIQPADFSGDFAVFLEYDGEFSSIVSFNQYGENVISAQMSFVKNSDEHFEMLLNEIVASLGEESITVQEATTEK